MKKPTSDNAELFPAAVKDARCFNDTVFFDLEIGNVTIYGCTIVEGKKGDFISFPSKKGKDGKYYHIAYAKLSSDDQAKIIKDVEKAINE